MRCPVSPLLSLLLIAAASTLSPSHALAGTGAHNTLASFQQNIRTDFDIEPFDGPDANPGPTLDVPGVYSYFVKSTSDTYVYRRTSGVAAGFYDQGLLFTFTGRPVTAFAGTFRVAVGPNLSADLAGSLNVQTNTGLVFPVSVPAGGGGAFFGFTTSEPFTSVVIADTAGQRYEFIDDVYVGTSITATVATDQCGDAPTVTPTSATSYPFVTTGNSAEAISNVCDGTTDSGPDIWFRYVAPITGSVTFSTCGCTFDSILRAFSSCPVGGVGTNQIACNDDFCTGGGVGFSLASQVSFRVVAGEDYLIRISGFDGGSGSGNLSFSAHADCPGDANHSGGLEVQDIFDFLNFWFAGCP